MTKKFTLKHTFTKKPKVNTNLLMNMPVPYEPMRKNRYLLKMVTEGEVVSEWFVAPVYNISVGGELTHEEFWVTFKDLIVPNTNPMHLITHLEDTTNMELHMLDPTGVAVSKWEMIGCTVSGTDFTDLDHTDDRYRDMKVLFNPEYTVKMS